METEQIINSVFKRQAIWNQFHPDHRNRYSLDELWAEVAEESKLTVKQVQAKWKNLRDYFRRELKKIPKPRSGGPADIVKKSHWPYFKNLLFLKDQLLPRETESNLQDDQNSNENDTNFSAVQSELSVTETERTKVTENDTEQYSSISPPTPSTSVGDEPRTILNSRSRKRQNPVDAIVAIEKEKMKYLLNKETTNKQAKKDPPDEHKLFFDSLLPHVQKIEDSKVLQFRNEIQNLVQKYAYEPSAPPLMFQSFNYETIINADDGSNSNDKTYQLG